MKIGRNEDLRDILGSTGEANLRAGVFEIGKEAFFASLKISRQKIRNLSLEVKCLDLYRVKKMKGKGSV